MTNTENTVKINRLTGDNVRALAEAQALGLLPAGTAITNTTATFPCDHRTAVNAIDAAKAHFNANSPKGSRNTTTRSLAAPRRKIIEQTTRKV